jgi:tRNA N6-adenosine threonylcarbamoyltransferase
MRVLGIETSCDETAAAVVADDGRVLSDVVRTQVEVHAPYGGVVPEIAARDHVRAIGPVVRDALRRADLALGDVDAVAVTNRPGLAGALLVGMQAAKGLAWAAGKPLVGVDHLLGHLLSPFLQRAERGIGDGAPAFPFLGLLVSGGHTALYRVDGPEPEFIRELGGTRDDAVGEAYDKVAKLLGLGYPGGPVVDRLAAQGDAARAPVDLPAPMGRPDSLEFSFSGLKSAVARHVAAAAPRGDAVADLCAAFQRSVVRTLVHKTLRAARITGIGTVVVAGGVAANRELRQRMAAACAEHGLALHIPPFASCTDNAAMIAYAGAQLFARGRRSSGDLAPATHTELARVTRKGRGKR